MSGPLSILLVNGAAHVVAHMQPLLETLERRGHTVSCIQLASSGNAKATMDDDVDAIRTAARACIEESDRELLVVLHSFSGRAGGAALPGLRMAGSRVEGHACGGLRGVIHIAAMVMSEDTARAMAASAPQWADWQYEDVAAGLIYMRGDLKARFYHDVPEPLASDLVQKLQPHSRQALLGVLPEGPRVATSPAFDGRRAYIYCTEDAVAPYAFQQRLVVASGSSWHTRVMHTSHSPFASQPDTVATAIEELGQAFGAESESGMETPAQSKIPNRL